MYDTIRFYQGFTIFNHYILSVGLCLCVRGYRCSTRVCECVCVRVSACMCVCLPICMSEFASECVYVCMCEIADTVLFILFYFHYRSCFVPLTVFILSSIFKRHDNFSSPHCAICYNIHFYINHLHFCSELAQSKGSVVSQTLTVDLFTADLLCKLHNESPFII